MTHRAVNDGELDIISFDSIPSDVIDNILYFLLRCDSSEFLVEAINFSLVCKRFLNHTQKHVALRAMTRAHLVYLNLLIQWRQDIRNYLKAYNNEATVFFKPRKDANCKTLQPYIDNTISPYIDKIIRDSRDNNSIYQTTQLLNILHVVRIILHCTTEKGHTLSIEDISFNRNKELTIRIIYRLNHPQGDYDIKLSSKEREFIEEHVHCKEGSIQELRLKHTLTLVKLIKYVIDITEEKKKKTIISAL